MKFNRSGERFVFHDCKWTELWLSLIHILKELEDKSDLKVSLKQNVSTLPKKIEEHIFRILQELISNTLRHAQASCLDVYLYQTDVELQLKVVDNGIGFQLGSLDDLSYGLRNIKERVEDMAGTVQLLTAPKQGLRCV